MGHFIAIDGLDGTGKHTQFELLSQFLDDSGIRVRKLEFPVYDSESSTLVKMYLSGALGQDANDTNAYAASMFFAADRYVSYATDWKKDYLDPDTVIVADRYTTANAIHQLSKLPREQWESFVSWLYDFEFVKLGLPRPDTVLFFEVPPEVSISLVNGRSAETGRERDIHERDTDFVRHSYEAGVWARDALGWVNIECSRDGAIKTREEIFDEIRRVVCGRLNINT